MLLAESEGDLQRVVNEFYNVCKRRKRKVNTGKSKVMVFERREEEVIDYNTFYRVRLPAVARCRIMLGSEKMEEVSEFKYLGTVLCKHGPLQVPLQNPCPHHERAYPEHQRANNAYRCNRART